MSKTSSTAFIGDREYTLRLDRKMVAELERITGCGFGLLHHRVREGFFHHSDLVEAIRLGLIGGGLDPAEAKRVVDVWIEDRPIRETYPVAADVLNALWRGPKPAEPETVSGSEDETEFVTRDDSADEPKEAPAPATYGALVDKLVEEAA